MLYISERIVNISELEKQIQNAKLYFDILKKELKNTAPSETIDGAVYQIDQSLKAVAGFEFLLEQENVKLQLLLKLFVLSQTAPGKLLKRKKT